MSDAKVDPTSVPEDVRELFNRVADRIQTPADERRLAALIETDPAGLAAYQQFMELHATLHWLAVAAALPGRPDDTGATAAGPAVATQPVNRPPRSPSWLRWPAAAAAIATLGIMVAIMLLVTSLVPALVPSFWPVARAAEPLGVIEEAVAATTGGGRMLRAGQPVPTGRLEIEAGAVAVKCRGGTRLLLEGPGALDLLDEGGAFLHAGNAVARMPRGPGVFRLVTASAEVVGKAAECGVKVTPGKGTEVQSYAGDVLATGRSSGPSARFPRRIEAGTAVRFSANADTEPQTIPYSESRFVRRLPESFGRPLTHVTDREERIRQFGRMRFDAIDVTAATTPVAIDGRLDEWPRQPGFAATRDGTAADEEWAECSMMYDAEHLYLAARVGDPAPLASVIDPEMDPEAGWRGGGVQVRLSTDRRLGWPVDANAPSYFSLRQLAASAADRERAENPRLSHLTMWFHAPSATPCLTIASGMNLAALAVNPPGFQGAFTRDPDGQGYVLEYAIPWRLLHASDDPPRRGDRLAAIWQVHWSDAAGRFWRDQIVEVRNPHEPHCIQAWERAAIWGRAEYR